MHPEERCLCSIRVGDGKKSRLLEVHVSIIRQTCGKLRGGLNETERNSQVLLCLCEQA